MLKYSLQHSHLNEIKVILFNFIIKIFNFPFNIFFNELLFWYLDYFYRKINENIVLDWQKLINELILLIKSYCYKF